MYSGDASPSFLSLAADIHGQPLYGDFSNVRMDSNVRMSMDIDTLTSDMRPQSDITMSYNSGGQPPSIGDVRQINVSEYSCSYQMYSDGQPPSVNDVGGREPSQSEPSCTRYNYEGPDAHEVQQPRIWEINPELRQACVGPLVNLPAGGTHVVHSPQSHSEQLQEKPPQEKMVEAPCFDKDGIKKGPWSVEEDIKLIHYIERYGHRNWRLLPKCAGLSRSGQSCRSRWINYLHPDLRCGNFRKEDDVIVSLQ